mmetsp:Transcript_39111/g.99314  ORF Transcript_39111/g.99314 Transcript_39111/m.99314 type:complete len:234 (-) Transcript_39111:126-827(-)
MAREVAMASRVSAARSASHCSFFARSSSSSFWSTSNILSMAATTSPKWLTVAASAIALKRASRLWRAAALRTLTADEERVEEATCTNEAALLSWEANDFLNRSRASSLFMISTAFEIAASSPVRNSVRSFHSCFFSARAVCTCSMYFLSLSICSVSESNSSCDSSLDKPLAPFSLSIFSKASSVAAFSAPMDSINLSKRATAASSFSFASVRSLVKSCKSFASTSWILKERAL